MGLTNHKSAPINEIIGFLELFGQDEIQGIRTRYPEYNKILKLGILLGSEDENDEIEELKVKTHVSKVGINIIIQEAEKLIPKIKSRLNKHNKIQFCSQTILALGSMLILVYPLEAINQNSKYIVGFMILIPALLTMYVQYKSGIIGSSEGNLAKTFNDLVDYKINAEHYLRELIILDRLQPSTSIKYAQEIIKKSKAASFLASTSNFIAKNFFRFENTIAPILKNSSRSTLGMNRIMAYSKVTLSCIVRFFYK